MATTDPRISSGSSYGLKTGNDFASKALSGLGYQLESSITAAVASAVSEGLAKQTPKVTALAEALNQGVRAKQSLLSVHSRLAQRMRTAVIEAYDGVERKDIPDYRVGQNRYGSGALRRAINDPSLVTATSEGIFFVDQGRLDVEAAHWHRLNFGAGRAAGEGGPARQAELTFDGVALATVAFSDTPSAPFTVPAMPGRVGYFTNEGQFFPGRPLSGTGNVQRVITSRLPTAGIKAEHFLDAGLVALGEGMDEEYSQWLRQLVDQAERTGKGIGTSSRVSVALRNAGF